MKLLWTILTVILLLLPSPVMAKTYSTNFPISENPLSESANWLNGGTCSGCGADWNNIKTTSGYAQQAALGNTGFDDGIAIVNGSWGSNQTVMIQAKNPTTQGGTQELEIHLRTTIAPHNITGYEIDMVCGGNIDIVRWNGPSNNFTILTTSPSPISYNWCAHTNPIIKATMSGSTITVYDCSTGSCSSIGTATDSTYTTGNPGIGTDVTIATTGSTDFGITQFIASDEGQIYNAASCSRNAVNTLVSVASNGDMVFVPSGSCTWNTTEVAAPSNTGITIIGAGLPNGGGSTRVPSSSCANGTTITINGSNGLRMSPQFGNATARISCMTIAYGGGGSATSGFMIEGTCTSSGCPNLRIDNVTFSNWAGHQSGGGLSYGVNAIGDMFGVIDHNSLIGSDGQLLQLVEFQHGSYLGVGFHGDNSWAQPENYGSANFLFFENNTFRWSGCCENEGDTGALNKRGGGRVVVRFNTFLDSDTVNFSMGWHGTESNGRERGARAFEYYANTWACNESCGSVAGGRSGTGLVWGNTINICNNPAVCAANNFFTFSTFRTQSNINWGPCDGSSVYDTNDGVTYFSGTIGPAGGGSSVITLSTDPGWSNNQWASNGSPYSVHDVTQNNGAEILSNTHNTITINNAQPGALSPWTPANSDSIQILRATVCVDQAGGRGAGNLYSGTGSDNGATSSNGGAIAAAMEAVSPSYLWFNPFIGRTTTNIAFISSTTARVIQDRDWYTETMNQGAQTSATSPFNGTSGTGHGTRANRPSTCTAGVGYFSTDQGSWNDGSNSNYTGQGVFDKCTGTNTWTSAFYTPYTYPHPLDNGVAPPAPPNAAHPLIGPGGLVGPGGLISPGILK